MIPASNIIASIAEQEKSPSVLLLISVIEQQQQLLDQQQEEILLLKEENLQLKEEGLLLKEKVGVLEAEIRRMKKLPPKPKIKSNLPNDDDDNDSGGTSDSDDDNRKPPSPRKRKKNLTIHKTEVVLPQDLPADSRLMGYQDYRVQDLIIQPQNTLYRLARCRTPEGQIVIGKLPEHLQGSHFGETLSSYILYQHYHLRVTQPLIHKQLKEFGVDISRGQISKILIEGKESLHLEKDELLTAGINHSSYIQADDTGARHNGKNGYCTHIGNETFAWFASTHSKSRINFLKLLRGTSIHYTLNEVAFNYMAAAGLSKTELQSLRESLILHFEGDQQWSDHLQRLKISTQRHIKIATEGALLGTLSASGLPPELVIISDDAGQFNILNHALCWIHANRLFQKIIPLNDDHTRALEWIHSWIWSLYADLQQYKKAPSELAKAAIEQSFDVLCQTESTFATLNQALKRLAKNKEELLLVLDHPEIPLHNNLSERDIREYVIKRKISSGTRSENGRRCRDTFLSLIKTCNKQSISVWDFIRDRTSGENRIPYLPDLVSGKVCPLKA